MKDVILWQRAEGGLVFIAGLVLFSLSGSDLAWFLALPVFFAPDLSFLAYGLGPRWGSWVYNTVHVYAFGLVLLALGMLAAQPLLVGLGALWLAHSGFDRMLGYGLKSEASFQDTHLGRIGKRG
ncbi:DUF4260 domain-containing protein [Devosia sediminis]|uniref:DUF4260 domain-containing protein n=1 Tax=Devosia sediminis TaxID=2798801 RepID=A0A934J0X0_9HYPH|nr:DUF4260 domain-containing protein [Devosia sediminis]MBJ3786238.1 DUF4260 domain-containing protein [Devosia sediminis]